MFKQLLVPLDRSPLAEQAIGQAASIARASHAALDIALVHEPLPFAGYDDAPWNAEQWTGEHKYLETVAQELESGAAIPVSHSVLRGGAVDMICARARDVDADLIVMTSHGRTGLNRAWMGSVADGVVRHADAAVLLLRPVEGKTGRDAAHHLFKKILVPIDGSALSMEILDAAASLASAGGARLVLLSVVQPVPIVLVDAMIPYAATATVVDQDATDRLADAAKAQIIELARRLQEQSSLEVEPHLVVAQHVAPAILNFARGHDIDAIAMSTHGRGASRFLLGSVADKVLRGSGLPMLVRRPVGVVPSVAERKVEHASEPAPALASV